MFVASYNSAEIMICKLNNTKMCTALLIDIAGKQQFIFSNNKLTLNIGASYIMQNEVLGTSIALVIDELKGKGAFTKMNKAWKDTPESLFDENTDICIGYIGGGNALLLFKDENEACKFIKAYSLKLLKSAAGLNPVFATANVDLKGNYKDGMKQIYERLNHNKAFYNTQTSPFKHGIEEECKYTGNAATIFNEDGALSKEAYLKMNAAIKSTEHLSIQLNNILKDTCFELSNLIDDYTPELKKKYIAVVHIDGNGLGQQFLEQESLAELRKLSVAVSQKIDLTLEKVIEHLVADFKIIEEANKEKVCVFEKDESIKLTNKRGKFILPIRPIINAGDDITFVCHGKLGIYLAELYMKKLNDPNIGGMGIPSCGGVAIFHAKYPFDKVYQLASELADDTKAEKRDENGKIDGCWLQFFMSSEGRTGHLKQIREDYQGKLMGPYEIGGTFDKLKEHTHKLYKSLSLNKIAKHREMIFATEDEQKLWQYEVQAKLQDNQPIELFEEFTYDTIELKDFYPKGYLNEKV